MDPLLLRVITKYINSSVRGVAEMIGAWFGRCVVGCIGQAVVVREKERG